MLTNHQQWAFDEIVRLLREGHKRIRLVGSAGTGKTYLVGELVRLFKKDRTINPDYNNGTTYVTAPTNKALAILKSKVDVPVAFSTIHSALKLRRYTNPKSGHTSFVRQKTFTKFRKGDEFDQCKIAVIDEASMLESKIEGNGLLQDDPNYIAGYLNEYNFPIIYVGDKKQLNPVNEPISPVWIKDYPEVELTEIIRQGAGNPIIELSRDLDMIYFKQPNIINGIGYTYSNARQQLVDDLAEVNGTDELKYLSYMNTDIDSMNLEVRQRRYGSPKRIEEGETIVFNSPMGEFYTNREVKVESVDIITGNIMIPTEKTKFYSSDEPSGPMDKLKIKYYRVNDAFNVIHEHSDDIFKSIFTTVKDNCANYGWDFRARDFIVEQYADIKYNHAITVHKSQGSTYKEAIVNIQNIDYNKDVNERERLLYTAVTRASNVLILNNVK